MLVRVLLVFCVYFLVCHTVVVSGVCNVTGPWTGYFPPAAYDDKEEYYFTDSVYDSNANTVSYKLVRTANGETAWSEGHGTIDLKTLQVVMHLDGIPGTANSVELNGNVTNDTCLTIDWDNGSRWVRQLPFIKYVHVIHMSHLDIGYDGISPTVGYINNVLNVYFQSHIPRANYLSKAMRQTGHSDRGYIYTQHPWLLSMYLDCPVNFTLNNVTLQCPTQKEIDDTKQSIDRGDLVWHASAFNLEFEAMDRSMFEASLNMAKRLNTQFKIPISKQTKVLSNRDVPGITRAVIPILNEYNVTAISIGQNPTLGPPPAPFKDRSLDVPYPKIFTWKDIESDTEVIAMWHSYGYGGIYRSDCVTVPYSEHALCANVLGDNSGPPKDLNQLLNEYTQIESEFPGAFAFSSTFSAFIDAIWDDRSQLPVVTSEFGDVWIQGIQSDPLKMAVYREASRAHSSCIYDTLQCQWNDSRIQNFERFLMKLPEHTWGLPSEQNSVNWSNSEFEEIRLVDSNFVNCSNAWVEQREFVDYAIEALQDHPLANDIKRRLQALVVTSAPDLSGYTAINDLNARLSNCNGLSIQFDGSYGNVISFEYNFREWSSVTSPLAYFEYVSYDETDFSYMCDVYSTGCYNKRGSQSADVREKWQTKMNGLFIKNDSDYCSVIARVSFPQESVLQIGAPMIAFVNFTVNSGESSYSAIDLEVVLINKTITRLPEALMFGFKPNVMNSNLEAMNFSVLKLGGSHIAFDDVMLNGSQYQHGFWEGIENVIYNSSESVLSKMTVSSLDCGLVSPITDQEEVPGWFGTPTVFPCPLQPLTKDFTNILGYAFNLFNNIWMTNYVLWYPYVETWPLIGSKDQNIKYRFNINFE